MRDGLSFMALLLSAVVRDGVSQQADLGIRVAEVTLEVAELINLPAKHVKYDILVHIG